MIIVDLLFQVIFVIVQLVFMVAAMSLVLTLLMAGVWEVGYKIQCALGWALGFVQRKLTRLAHTLQGHQREPVAGFQIADDYPPKPHS